MKKRKKSAAKGFWELSSLSSNQRKKLNSQQMREIHKKLQEVDEITQKNKENPQALKNFTQLVKEGNTEKLTEYFKQYGIDTEIIRLNLDSLIAEELKDLKS